MWHDQVIIMNNATIMNSRMNADEELDSSSFIGCALWSARIIIKTRFSIIYWMCNNALFMFQTNFIRTSPKLEKKMKYTRRNRTYSRQLMTILLHCTAINALWREEKRIIIYHAILQNFFFARTECHIQIHEPLYSTTATYWDAPCFHTLFSRTHAYNTY